MQNKWESSQTSGNLITGQLSDGEVEISAAAAVDADSQTHFFALDRLKNPTVYDKIASIWSSLFCWLGPLGRVLFDHYEVPKSVKLVEKWEKVLEKKTGRDKEDMDIALRIRGAFNLKNIIDMMSFRWTRLIAYIFFLISRCNL